LSSAAINSGVSAVAVDWLGFATGIAFPTLPSGSPYAYVGQTPSLAASTTYVISAYVKMDDGLPPSVGKPTSPENDFALVIANSAIPFNAYTVESVGSDVYRVSARFTTGSTVPAGNAGIYKYAANTPRPFKATGFQVEQASFASSYIPTTTAAVTRASDVTTSTAGTRAADTVASAAMTRAADFVRLDTTRGWLNAGSGTFAFTFRAPPTPPSTVILLEAGVGDLTNRVGVACGNNNTVYAYGTTNGAGGNVGPVSITPGTTYKAAVSYDSADGIRFSLNGSNVVKLATQKPSFAEHKWLGIGTTNNGGGQPSCHIVGVRYFPQKLTDAEVSALTA